jgi:predicted GNAT family acetyltransferase
MTAAHNSVTDNTAQARFELVEEGHTAFANYRLSDGTLSIPYVESPTALRGKGTAGRLLEGVVAHARARGLKIVPICGYAVSWFQRHPEHDDIIKAL